MNETLAPVQRLPLRPTAKPGDRICCTPEQGECFDFKTLLVCWTAFWGRDAHCRRYSNVVRDVRRIMDEGNLKEGEPPDPDNYAAAHRWVDHAIAARLSPLSVAAAKRP